MAHRWWHNDWDDERDRKVWRNDWFDERDKKVFVRKLARATTGTNLKNHFKRFGAVQAAWVLKNTAVVSTRCGFVVFRTSQSAQACLYEVHEVIGKVIQVVPARAKGCSKNVRLASTPDWPDYSCMARLIQDRTHELLHNDHTLFKSKTVVYSKMQDILGALGCDVYQVGSSTRGADIGGSDLDLACLRDPNITLQEILEGVRRFANTVHHENAYFDDGFENMDNFGTAILKPSPKPEVVLRASVPAMKLRYTHDNISRIFTDGRSVDELVQDLVRNRTSHETHPNLVLDCVAILVAAELLCYRRKCMKCGTAKPNGEEREQASSASRNVPLQVSKVADVPDSIHEGAPPQMSLGSKNRGRIPLFEDSRILAPGCESEEVVSLISSASAHNSSKSSSVSLISSSGFFQTKMKKCFLKGTLLKFANGTFTPAELLVQHSLVQSVTEQLVQVMSIALHGPDVFNLVSLRVSDTTLVVTASHRVEVMQGDHQQSLMASSLEQGDLIVCNTGVKDLLEITKFADACEIVEIFFEPDVPVEAFHPPIDLILTKGACPGQGHGGGAHSQHRADDSEENDDGKKTRRRGGMNRRGKSQKGLEMTSIPQTHDSWW